MIGNFTRGFIDGSLSTLGIVIGASSASSSVIIAAAAGGALANGVSNVLSAFAATGSEEYAKLRDLEKAMVARDLKDTAQDQEIGRKTSAAGAVDGVATVIGGALPIAPYLFVPPFEAMLMASGLVIGVTFLFGIYLGKVSRRNVLYSATKMALLATLVAATVYVVQLAFIPPEAR